MTLGRSVAFGALERLRVGTLVVIENGSRRVFGSGPPRATAHVRSPRVWPMLLLRGSRGLAGVLRGRIVGVARSRRVDPARRAQRRDARPPAGAGRPAADAASTGARGRRTQYAAAQPPRHRRPQVGRRDYGIQMELNIGIFAVPDVIGEPLQLVAAHRV